MFKVAVQKVGGEPLSFQQVVCVDSLYEAEIMALRLASNHFEGRSIMLVHTGGLIYDIFEVGEPIGQVRIRSGG